MPDATGTSCHGISGGRTHHSRSKTGSLSSNHSLIFIDTDPGDEVVSIQFSSVPLRFGRRGDMGDDSVEILFQSFQRESTVSSSSTAGTSTL